uniref:Uncharacterized protein n=1 Tax=Kwoniella pini CBS 10737 TaxID=1296096 RepID=A0A1B9I9V7_9TREE|nr:uncharacterized protein I206_01615 [Kwoniella pini CBS 10737]OCF52326.1 hypothetical protein I206_01615 [Kwoniella pini CBS 10737]
MLNCRDAKPEALMLGCEGTLVTLSTVSGGHRDTDPFTTHGSVDLAIGNPILLTRLTFSEAGQELRAVKQAGRTTGALVGAVAALVTFSSILVYLYRQKRPKLRASQVDASGII